MNKFAHPHNMLYILAHSWGKGNVSMTENAEKHDSAGQREEFSGTAPFKAEKLCPGSYFPPGSTAKALPGTALVTGASRGIGLAIAQALAEDGWNLILTCSKTGEVLDAAARRISQNCGTCVRCAVCDMSDPSSVRSLFDGISSLDLLVNNAGTAWYGLLQDMSDAEWNRILSVNLSSVFYTCRAAIPLFLRQGNGRIINISSVWGDGGAACEAAYSAAKGGVNALTGALAKELAPAGIPVNAVACGCVDTQMNAHLLAEERAALMEEIPAGRFAAPEEIAACVLRLAQMPAYLTGQIITVDGGWQ